MRSLLDREHLTLGLMVATLMVLTSCAASQSQLPAPPAPPAPTPPTSGSPAPSSVPETPAPPSPPSAESAEGSEPSSTTPVEASADGSEAGDRDGAESADAAEASDAAAPAEASGATAPAEASGAEASGASAPAGVAATTTERRAGLDGKLDESLREFDGLILKEQAILDERREEGADVVDAGGGSAGSGSSGDLGAGDEGDSEDGAPQMAGGTGASPDAPGDEVDPSSPGAIGGDERPAPEDQGRVPKDVGDGRDDDIVARQLREAAMNEEDPELRERLWDEYRAYKRGTKSE